MLWNRINIENADISLVDSKPCYLIIDCYCKINITLSKDIISKLVIISNNDYDINLKLDNSSNLIVNSINKDNNVNVNIFLKEGSTITYNHSTLSLSDSINNFNIHHLENNSISNINNNGINRNNGKLYFNIDGVINSSLHNITCNQKSKIINYNNGNSKIIPNLIINSNDIIANHSAYIGKIEDEEKFYLKTRGINEWW